MGAFLKIPLGPSAITLQFFFTAMAGCLLGSGCGALSQLIYVALGLLGLPVFTAGGGFSYVLHPTFGFLLGLIPAAWVIGRLARSTRSFWRIALAALAGLAVLYAVGLPYMAMILNGYMGKGMDLCCHFVGRGCCPSSPAMPENSGDGSADAAHPPGFG